MSQDVKVYQVGGSVRDEFLGRTSNDLDFTVVAENFDVMRDYVVNDLHGTVFLENPEFLTLRAKVPGMTTGADFVLARRDGTYTDGRRPDSVEMGSLYDDLARRDFTCNAMSRDTDTGELVDPFNGVDAVQNKVLSAVGDPNVRFAEDGLRVLRAWRFQVSLGFTPDAALDAAMRDPANVALLDNVSMDRKRDEVNKAFRADSVRAMRLLMDYPGMFENLFGSGVLWLKATTEGR